MNGTRLLARIAVIAALAASGAVTACAAEALDVAQLQAAAQQGDRVAGRTLGEALVYGSGGVAQDKAAGVHLLDQAAAAGDIEAKAGLGKILLDGYYAPADPARAQALLAEAAAAGNTAAQLTLGLALLWGGALPADPPRARDLLAQAAQAGNPEATRTLGEQLLGGWVLKRDAAAGRALLEKAVAAGDSKAALSLGKTLLYGTGLPVDRPKALALFETAARAGSGEGIELYGEWLMWTRDDPARAESLLRRAAGLGRRSAWTTLAEGAMYDYLPPDSAAKVDGYAARAHAAGDKRIVVVEAARLMWGKGVPENGPGAVALLEQAVKARNAQALKYLVGLVRDGNGYNVAKAPARARDYLARNKALLSATEQTQLALTIEAASATSVAALEQIARKANSQPGLRTLWFAQQLYKANPNAVIYLLQADMKRRGIYKGALDGVASGPALRAFWQACAELGDPARCRSNVMHPDALAALVAR